ncbi:response regulator [Thermanaerovibrio acidaminovorans]|jgi:two-component system chemotaxis response regulator CheY|uniref:response regulator n=1 Tax=Thermanaerovibrio acidaminovorans TaxID=81462 RepID=UPI00248F4AE6|nr:response regulator [Thermanaerovibrio acidaminovorans]
MALRFLVADDDVSSGRLFRIYLEDMGEVVLAEDGQEALRLFKEALDLGNPFDGVVLDMLMPRADGAEVLEGIRTLESSRGLKPVPVVVISALDQEEVEEAMVRDPMGAMVQKPVLKGALIGALKGLMGG